jgi:hypothetical protein
MTNGVPSQFQTNYPQIIDGFCYSGLFGTRPLNRMSWYWSCLANLEDLRLAADSYRPRQWVVPKNFIEPANPNNANILPGKTSFYEFQVLEGSWLYGLQFAVFQGLSGVEVFPQSNFSVIIRQGTELPFMDRVFTCSGIAAGNPTDPLNTQYPALDLLRRPRLIIPPCQLHVELSNDLEPEVGANAVSVQLLMLFAEPKS